MLQERSGNNSYTHEALSLKYKLDNEFELIFVVSIASIFYYRSATVRQEVCKDAVRSFLMCVFLFLN